ncbi:hypothetical protein [Flavobacterium rhizosphaerae]|uniref:DUF4595 domain-containing protein n=1 Tax=Flavobacterium rhizosphaerae TaxID=3163298 RepID=A0ABW8YU86_9FLAO
MKKKVFMLGITALLFTACTDNDNQPIDDENAMMLDKVVQYSPSKAEYDSGISNGFSLKLVKYYQDNRIVADTLFKMSGSMYRRCEYMYTSNTYIKKEYDDNNNLMTQQVATLDGQGRIISIVNNSFSIWTGSGYTLSSENEIEFTYNSNTITRSLIPQGNETPMAPLIYDLNSFGIISEYTNSGSMPTIDGDKLVSGNFNGITTTFSYYPNPMPENLAKNTVELNNRILMEGLYILSTEGNYYLQNAGLVNYDKQFNTYSYIIYDKAETIDAASYGANFYDEAAYEAFYYYN